MKELSYQKTLGTIFFDQETEMPIGFIDDIIINPETLKIESFIIKSSFFRQPQILSYRAINSPWSEKMYIDSNSLKDIEDSLHTKNILEQNIAIIWNTVQSETNKTIGVVTDMNFQPSSGQGTSLIIRQSFAKLFYYGKERIIPRNDIIEIKEEQITIKDTQLAKSTT